MFDADDTPGYLHDAYRSALDKGLISLNLTRIGAGENRMWQASSRFPKSDGYHVEIEADALEAVMKALGGWARIGAPAPAGLFDEPEDLQRERRDDRDEAGGFFDEPSEPRKHDLWKTTDIGVPLTICDSNGEVVLGQCKVCGRGEIELEMDDGVCPGSVVCDEPDEYLSPADRAWRDELMEAAAEPAEREGEGLFD